MLPANATWNDWLATSALALALYAVGVAAHVLLLRRRK